MRISIALGVLAALAAPGCSRTLKADHVIRGPDGFHGEQPDLPDLPDEPDEPALTPALPLVVDAEVDLPVNAGGFDYQDIDADQGHLVIAHQEDDSVDIVNLEDGAFLQEIPKIPTASGVIVASDVGRIFVTSAPHSLVAIDNTTFAEVARVTTGRTPDGVGWDPVDHVVGVSNMGDGAVSLIADSGSGAQTKVPLGLETGNVLYDASRGWFWVTVVQPTPPDQLVALAPADGSVQATLDLAGCVGAHGLKLHPDNQSAFVACEGNDTLVRVDLASGETSLGATGAVPDVMVIDPEIGWLYVAAHDGDLTVFNIDQPGVVPVGHDTPGDESHTIAVDPVTHRVFFPLPVGPNGTPVLRILRPSGI